MIYSKSLYTERNTKTNYKWVQTPGFFPEADLYAGKGKISQKQPYCNKSKKNNEK